MFKTVCTALVLAGSLLSTTSIAVAAPVEQTIGEIALLHGGVGIDQRNAMEQARSGYNLRLTFATKGSGAYLSGIRVQISDHQGTSRIDTIASGPWLFARLPAGDYIVTATAGKQTLRQKISIKGSAAREWVFRFDTPSSAR
jgi:hypothetical protein